jgi:hypothetical protein
MDHRQYDCRLYERMTVSVPGEIFVADEVPVSCTVVNLSGSGARIQTARLFGAYAPILLYIEDFGRFDGITIPRSGDMIAVHFILGPEKLKAYLETLADYRFRGKPGSARLRRHPRTAVTGSGHFRRTNGQTVVCEILYVSLQGVGLSTETRPAVGEIIAFGPARGRVVRHHDKGIGVFLLRTGVASP